MISIRGWVLASAVLALCLIGGPAARGAAKEGGSPVTVAEIRLRAPEFPAGLEWLNTDHPLRLADLRGKIVLLDFWTYCCINCMHIIPDLKRLEAKYPDELVVIGVHSAKFIEEGQTANIRQAMLRYGIRHPVVNDNHLQVWGSYGVSSWPTVILIDPDGRIAAGDVGEGIFAPMDAAIGELLRQYDATGRLDRRPLTLRPEQGPASALEFPGKVLADAAGGRLFIADSGHNRIVVAGLADGAVRTVIGDGREGLKDGKFAEARFNHPQGMALGERYLYVADTENHVIRRADLESRTVETIAGTGRQARGRGAAGPARETALSSPWDLVREGDSLYIAMAGVHQIWRMNLATDEISLFAGSGGEGRFDGPLHTAALAQPSGIATDHLRLYVADSEVSSVRGMSLSGKGGVETIVGGDLFDFGDRDGKGLAVRLQHPLGITFDKGRLYVADTYNNKIKVIEPETYACRTLLGTGKAGSADGDRAEFYEPGGLSVAGDRLYIADTNNHAIRVADLKTRRVETFRLKGLEAPAVEPEPPAFTGVVVHLPPQIVAPGAVTLEVTATLPAGYKPTADAPTAATVRSGDRAVITVGGETEKTLAAPVFPVRVGLATVRGKTDLTVDLVIYYCEAARDSVCLLKQVRLIVPVEVAPGAKGSRITMAYTVPKP
jgi:thiol-disulfide isomerase/thioredoxin